MLWAWRPEEPRLPAELQAMDQTGQTREVIESAAVFDAGTSKGQLPLSIFGLSDATLRRKCRPADSVAEMRSSSEDTARLLPARSG